MIVPNRRLPVTRASSQWSRRKPPTTGRSARKTGLELRLAGTYGIFTTMPPWHTGLCLTVTAQGTTCEGVDSPEALLVEPSCVAAIIFRSATACQVWLPYTSVHSKPYESCYRDSTLRVRRCVVRHCPRNATERRRRTTHAERTQFRVSIGRFCLPLKSSEDGSTDAPSRRLYC